MGAIGFRNSMIPGLFGFKVEILFHILNEKADISYLLEVSNRRAKL